MRGLMRYAVEGYPGYARSRFGGPGSLCKVRILIFSVKSSHVFLRYRSCVHTHIILMPTNAQNSRGYRGKDVWARRTGSDGSTQVR
jgi:hypothetical protein